jgi:lysophospholipase L1-like esterase
MMINNNDIVLFQGDSITDAGRNKENGADLGNGYVMMIAAWFVATHPDKPVTFINRGISGNRTKDLENRWQSDCLDLKPTWVSLMIGINDCWRRYDRNDPTTVEQFATSYRHILQQTKETIAAQIILMEPFVLPVPEDRKGWREDLEPKIKIVHELAQEFGTILIPLDRIFTKISVYRPPDFWAPDGVHPSAAGHAVIAREWLQTVKTI